MVRLCAAHCGRAGRGRSARREEVDGGLEAGGGEVGSPRLKYTALPARLLACLTLVLPWEEGKIDLAESFPCSFVALSFPLSPPPPPFNSESLKEPHRRREKNQIKVRTSCENKTFRCLIVRFPLHHSLPRRRNTSSSESS